MERQNDILQTCFWILKLIFISTSFEISILSHIAKKLQFQFSQNCVSKKKFFLFLIFSYSKNCFYSWSDIWIMSFQLKKCRNYEQNGPNFSLKISQIFFTIPWRLQADCKYWRALENIIKILKWRLWDTLYTKNISDMNWYQSTCHVHIQSYAQLHDLRNSILWHTNNQQLTELLLTCMYIISSNHSIYLIKSQLRK